MLSIIDAQHVCPLDRSKSCDEYVNYFLMRKGLKAGVRGDNRNSKPVCTPAGNFVLTTNAPTGGSAAQTKANGACKSRRAWNLRAQCEVKWKKIEEKRSHTCEIQEEVDACCSSHELGVAEAGWVIAAAGPEDNYLKLRMRSGVGMFFSRKKVGVTECSFKDKSILLSWQGLLFKDQTLRLQMSSCKKKAVIFNDDICLDKLSVSDKCQSDGLIFWSYSWIKSCKIISKNKICALANAQSVLNVCLKYLFFSTFHWNILVYNSVNCVLTW